MKKAHERIKSDGKPLTRADEIYNQIRTEILELNLRPGDQLDEDGLATKYGVSRTPVREALRRLGSDGLVTVRPHRGASVSEISLREIWEIEQICEIAEPFAARIAAGRVPLETVEELKQAHLDSEIVNPQREDYIRYMKLDVQFHGVILDAAGNETMSEIITHLHRRMNAVRLIANRHRYTHSIAEHKAILSAIEAADGDAAYEAMKIHIQNRAMRQRHGLLDAIPPPRSIS
jgi:DNA-binding GntR family transcriptional regulator